MNNKLTAVILVLLVIIIGGSGYYSFTLHQQIDDLSQHIAVFEGEQQAQQARVDTLGNDLNSLRTETNSGISSLDTQISAARADISTAQAGLAAATDRIAGAEEQINGVSSQVTTLDERIAGTEASITGLSQSVIAAGSVYDKAVKAVVRISDGAFVEGSGFIYDTQGRVLTAYHVVSDLSPIFVIMYDGRVSRASIVGYSQPSDIAVLKLDDNPDIEPLPLGDSSRVKVGEPVIAIGAPLADVNAPLGMRDTLTSGIISQVNRYENIEGNYVANLLQFDAAINSGNSGCALINSSGEVIGIVNARIDPTIGDGIYWAISSNKAKRVAEAVIATGSFPYPLIGVGISDLTPDYVVNHNLATSNGALVGSVTGGSGAQAAGIKLGDIIVSINGVPARNISDLTCYLGEHSSPGDVVVLGIIRGGSTLTISVTVGKRPD
jgi:S1-C subfamily serine protease